MRFILYVTYCPETFSAAVKDGSVGGKLKRILEDTKPEAVYFGEHHGGDRGAAVVVNIEKASDLPRYTEPWFLTFGGQVAARPVMTPEDVAAADMADIAAKYA